MASLRWRNSLSSPPGALDCRRWSIAGSLARAAPLPSQPIPVAFCRRCRLALPWSGVRASIAKAVGVGLVVAVMTYLSLVIGELVPKQIALRDPEKIAVRVAPAMTALGRIASPVVS